MSSFPAPSGSFWAKLHPRENPTRWHPLIAHSADVAAVMERLLVSGSVLAQRLAATSGSRGVLPELRARLVFLATLHDIGKTSHGFQSQAVAVRRSRYPAGQRGHVQVLLNSIDAYTPLGKLLDGEVLPVVSIDLDGAAWELFLATIGHHGRPWMPRSDRRLRHLWTTCDSGRDPLAEIRRLIEHARRWSGVDEWPNGGFATVTPAFTHLYAGALTLADWIGSTRTAFDFAPWADDRPDEYWPLAQERAADACARIGLVPWTRPVAVDLVGLPLLEQLFPTTFRPAGASEASGNTPTDLQRRVATMPPPQPGTRLLIESETGSGKTEAALALYARLRAAGLVGGLMFALPTRATASAMFERVQQALAGIYPEGDPPTVALAVGGQQPRAESSEPLVGETPLTYPDEPELERWASSSSKKFLAAEVVVGTVDQVLLAGLPVKHAHLRLAALSRHLLVVDELHSYDRYMTGVLRRVLELHGGAGGISLFMSATLSDTARTHFARAGAAGRDAQSYSLEEAHRDVPYPALGTLVPGTSRWEFEELESQGRPKGVAWSAVTEAEALLEAAAAARAGARVLVLCNTVRRARAAVQALREAGHAELLWRPPGAARIEHTPPYHARYTLPDRLALDAAVGKRFGKPAAAVAGGVILVATQVAEQSLDVDFDLLVTDLAPVDVLLQRIGRLHRHRARDAHRPDGYRAARALVISPEGGSFAPHLQHRALDLGWGEKRPYRHFSDGELTLRAMADRPRISIPADNRRLVESVYHADARELLWADPAWDRKMLDRTGAELNLTWAGEEAALDFAATYTAVTRAFDAARERNVRTRLGDETVRIKLDGDVRCWYSDPREPVRSADLAVWMLPADADNTQLEMAVPTEVDATGTRFRFGRRTFHYAPDGWRWEDGVGVG